MSLEYLLRFIGVANVIDAIPIENRDARTKQTA